MRISPSYLALAGCVVVGGYLLVGDDEAPANQARGATARTDAIPAMFPRLPGVDGEPESEVETDEEHVSYLTAASSPATTPARGLVFARLDSGNTHQN